MARLDPFPKLKTFELPEFTPSQKAKFQIQSLNGNPEFMQDYVLGGPTPPEMLEANKRKAAAYFERCVEIIVKHGVIDEYLEPLKETARRLAASLAETHEQIAALEAARTPA